MNNINDAIAFVLVGGFGTRLRSVIGDETPKPLALIDGEPFLKLLLHWLEKQGIRHVVLGTGYLAEKFEEEITSYAPTGMTIQFSREEKPLGTGGAIRNAANLLGSDPFFVLNGDSIVNANLCGLMAFHHQKQAKVTLSLAPVPDASRFGTVVKDELGRIVAYKEKTGEPIPGEINAGIYVVSQEFLRGLPDQEVFSFEKDVLSHIDENPSYAMTFNSEFIDIGTPESYCQASDFFKRFL
ncbi:MAG: NTP transferase domain-containing protein [Armatimonadetes bacterium]|nr:NTP transferase domain-containing protein [Armatimonadota bacterium]